MSIQENKHFAKVIHYDKNNYYVIIVNMTKHDPKKDEMSLKEINRQIENRVDNIEKEFHGGFDFIKNCETSVTFFGSARTDENHKEYKKAVSIAARITEELGYAIITGGGPGIMEAGNRGAFETGGRSLGLTIKLPFEQVLNPYMHASYPFNYFFARKTCLAFAAEAYLFFPGGFGTLDELFEILTLVQTKKMHDRPIILVGKKFWKPIDKFIKKQMLKGKKIDPQDLDLYTITDNEKEIIEIIRKSPIHNTINE